MARPVSISTPLAPRHSGRALGLKQMPNPAQTCWNLIRGAKKWLAVTVGLFVLGAVAGVVVGITNPSLNERLLEHPVGPQIGFPSLVFLLKLNLTSTLLTWCTSFILGITPFLITLREGFSTGGLLVYRSPLFAFLSLAPHGLVEIPAILLCNAFFLRLGLRWVFQKNATDRKRAFVADFQNSLRILLLGSGMFFIAAMIESFATPRIVAPYEQEHLAGIGIRVAVSDHQLTVAHVFPGSPAASAGLSSGLVIHSVDGVEPASKDVRRCQEMLHGRVGTMVRLEVIDTARNRTNSIELVRDLPPL
jgi:uncharacterized membrane protein SpoIIM required for sporulation